MKTQQAAEREEQQRIKNLVLNYDLHDGEEQDGDSQLGPLLPNPNIHTTQAGLEKTAVLSYARPDKSSNSRSGQRARKLQLSDVDWYDNKSSSPSRQLPSSPLATHGSPSGLPGKLSAVPPSVASGNQCPVQGRVQITRRAMLEEHSSRKVGANKK